VRQDTGHPFGFLRALSHEDGHVLMSVNSAADVDRVDAMADLFAEMGLTVYRAGWLPVDEVAIRYLAGLECERCRPRLSCGCDIVQDVLTGACRHGTRKALFDAATRCRYRDRVPRPVPGGQAELDAYARQIAGLDRQTRRRR
jgi:hypothetical protein